ncbi:MAG TPA: hypothetical protein VGK41_01010 [Solirubrobacterales bacterium]
MIWGIEGRHDWTPPGAGEAAIRLNGEFDDAGKREWPHIKVKSISGLHSLGDSEDKRDPRIGQVGENPRLSFRRGKTITYECSLRCKTLVQLRTLEQELRDAFADQETEGRMDVTAHPLNADFEGEPAKFYEARAIGLEIIDRQDGAKYWRPAVIVVRTSDPRYFEEGAAHVLNFVQTDKAGEFV